MKRIWKLQYGFGDATINCFTWYQHSSWFICFCAFKIWYCKKQYMYCFLPFGFINVIIFVINPSGSYIAFFGAYLEYPNSLRYDTSYVTLLRYDLRLQFWTKFQTVMVLCLIFGWIRNSSDLRRDSWFFKVFKFWNFKTSSFCVRHHFYHYIQYELPLENYCKSLLV